MKPLLLALLAVSMLVSAKLFAQTDMKYYQYSKTQSFDVGVQPHYVYYDKTTQKAHVFCTGQDLNYDGVKDDGDFSPSWWTIDMANGGNSSKVQDFAFGSFNIFYFRPAVDEQNRKIYISSANKIYGFGLDNMELKDSIIAPNTIEGMTYGFGSIFMSVNPTYGSAGKVLVYRDGALKKEIPVGVMAQNIAVYSNSKTQKAIAVISIGNYGEKSSVSFIEFGENDEYTKADVEIGITANSIYFNNGYIYAVCNSTNNTYKINAENYKVEKILHSGTTGWNGPRQIAFNNEYGFISDFNGDIRMVDLNKGVKDIINIGGKIEGIAMLSDESFLTAIQMKADYSSNNSVELYKKKEFNFEEYHDKNAMYDFCETCEKPQVLVGDDYGTLFVLCVGDSTKGILPSISRISTMWPCSTQGTTFYGLMQSNNIFKFDSYEFKNPPTMSLAKDNLYVSTDKKIYKFNISSDKAVKLDEYDFPSAFYLNSGIYFEKDYVIGLNKEGSMIVIGDETNIKKSDKPLIDGAMTTNFASGDVSSAILYNVNDKADLELKYNENNLYLNEVGKNGKIFTDDNFSMIFCINYSESSSEIKEYDLPTMKLLNTLNSGLVNNTPEKGIYSPKTIGINSSQNTSALAIPSELGDIRFIDMPSGQLSNIIPMPSGTKGYYGKERYFYTLLPNLNLVCIYGMVSGAVKDNSAEHDINFKIYPNPANSITKIELSHDYGKVKLEVVNITGEVVQKSEFYGNTTSVNLHQLNLPTGYYNVIVTTNSMKGIQPLIIIK